jgi:hypothetical protein
VNPISSTRAAVRRRRIGLAVVAGLAFAASAPAWADIAGFTQAGAGPTDFTLNANAQALAQSVPNITGGILNLTSNNQSEATSAFFNTPQAFNNWTANYTYTKGAGTANPADGFAFVLQNDPRGLTALGGAGGALGYDGGPESIVNSSAVIYDLYNGGAANPTRVGHAQQGTAFTYQNSTPIDLRSGVPVNVSLSYNSGVITQTLTQGANTFTNTFARNLPAILGGSTAIVGFTGGTGGESAAQSLSNFTFTVGNAPPPSTPAAQVLTGVPQGGAGFFGIREVQGAPGCCGDLNQAQTAILGSHPNRAEYTAPVLNIYDSDTRGTFQGDSHYKLDPDQVSEGTNTVDNIAVIATGRIRIPTTGVYTFGTNSDDGFRLTIGGQRFETVAGQGGTQINNNGALEFPNGRGAGEASLGHIHLTAGDYDIQMLNWEGGGGASVELYAAQGFHTSINTAFNLIGAPASAAPRRAGIAANGFQVVNFNNVGNLADAVTAMAQFRAGTRTPDAVANDVPTIFYSDPQNRGANKIGQSDFGNDRPFPNDTAGDDNTFATGAVGQLTITTGGRYTFDVLADDSIRLRLTNIATGQDVDLAGFAGGSGPGGVNTDGDAANDALQTSGCCSDAFAYYDLAPGNYSLELIHQEGGGGASLALFGAFGQFDSFDPTLFQLIGQNIDTTVNRPAGLELVGVPEPTTAGVLAIAALGLTGRRRRR